MKESDPSQDAATGGIWSITRILKTMSADMTHLLVLEAQLFGRTALAMIGLMVAMALLLVSGWLFLAAALTLALASLPALGLVGALLTMALAHLVLAALAYWLMRRGMRDLAFRESRASLGTLITLARALAGGARQRPEEE